jgi:hypothetical protein
LAFEVSLCAYRNKSSDQKIVFMFWIHFTLQGILKSFICQDVKNIRRWSRIFWLEGLVN